MAFIKATKAQAKLRCAVDGPAGSGKTYTSLLLAKYFGGSTAVIDTEHGAASKYADLFDFATERLDEFSLKTYLAKIQEAKEAGFQNLIIDSLSHSWNGKGGALQQVERMGGNTFSNGWRHVTPLTQQLTESILSYPGHVFATMRLDMDYVVEKDEHSGKMVPKKVGLAPVARKGMEYEFDVILNCGLDGKITVTKTRCPALRDGIFTYADTEKIANALKAWLTDGTEVSNVDKFKDEIRFATSRKGLMDLLPMMKALPQADQEQLKPAWLARIAEFPEAQ